MGIVTSCWDYACPTGISFPDHCKSISIYLAQLLNATRFDGVIVVSPEIAAIVETHHTYRATAESWGKPGDWPLQIGVLCTRMPIWLDPFIPYDEARVYDELGGEVLGILKVVNISGYNRNPLDFMAQV